MADSQLKLVLAIGISLLANDIWAADSEKDSPPIPESTNVRSVAKLKSASVGTGFVVLTEGRKAYLLTAAHVVGGISAEEPDCHVEFGTADRRAPCTVRYVWSNADLAVVYANLEGIPSVVKPLELGDSALLATTGARIYTAGYPGGGKLRIDRGFVSGAEPPKFVLKGISAKVGQSGSPIFTESDGRVVGMILERPLDGREQLAREVDSIKLFLRQEQLFQYLILFTRPPSGASGPLVPSDEGLSLSNTFNRPASPHRWFDRAKRYYRSDSDVATISSNDSWLGIRREYLSSSSNTLGSFGRGWTSQFEYHIDMQRSDICNLHLWNPKNNRVILRPPHECAKVRDSLSSRVESQDILEGNLVDIMADKDLADNILPGNVSFTGADFDVLRARFVIGGIEVIVGSRKYVFNKNGELRRVEMDTRSLELNYDAKGRLSVVRDGQRTQEFLYSSESLVTAVRFDDGTEFTYKYSPDDRLTNVGSSSGRGYLYEYGREGLLERVIEYKGKGESETWTIRYTTEGRRSSVVHGDEEYRWRFVDSVNDMPSIDMDILQDGKIREKRAFQFDYQTNTLSMAVNGDITVYELTECLCLPFSVESGNKNIAYSYDPFGRLTEIQSGETRTTYEYDNRFNKVSKYTRWISETLSQTAEATYDSKGNLIHAKSDEGLSITLTYDKEGRIASVQDGADRSVKIAYNLFGKPIIVKREGLGEIEVSYKEDGEILRVNSEDGPMVAVQVANTFNTLIEAIAPLTAGAQIDSRFSILTSEPGGCDECSRHQGD